MCRLQSLYSRIVRINIQRVFTRADFDQCITKFVDTAERNKTAAEKFWHDLVCEMVERFTSEQISACPEGSNDRIYVWMQAFHGGCDVVLDHAVILLPDSYFLFTQGRWRKGRYLG